MSHRPQLRMRGRIATIDELVVTEPWRKRGVGKALLEKAIERTSIALHRGTAALLAGAGTALAQAGGMLRHTGQHLHKRIACL